MAHLSEEAEMLDIHHDEVEATANHSNQCHLCNKLFSKQVNLNKHLLCVHGISSTTSQNYIHCLEELCLCFPARM